MSECRNMVGGVCALRATLAAAAAVVVSCTTADGLDVNQEKAQIDNSSEILAQTLRRQLIANNYDYISSASRESEPDLHVKRTRESVEARREKAIIATVLDGERGKNHPRDKISSQENDKNKNFADNHKVRRNIFRRLAKRRKKIRKYMYGSDDDVARRYISRYTYNILDDVNSVPDRSAEHSTTVKYKILKLRSPYRRSGLAAALIQEESPQGVSIVKLGTGPFPEFRLPPPRRQYMAAPAAPPALGDDEPELPPPPVELARAETSAVTLDTIRQSQPYFNNGEDTLKITVTPDEILVL